MNARRRMAALAATTLAAVLAGCATPGPGSQRTAPPVLSTVDCPAAMPGLGAGDPTAAPAAQPLPAGFVPADVVRCTLDYVDRADGRWQVVTATHYGGDYTALLAALAEPDDPPSGPGQACPAIGYLVSPIWLVAHAGGAFLVRHPLAICGAPKAAVDDAFAALPVTRADTVPIRLVAPRAAVDANCDTGWKYLPPVASDDGTASAVADTMPAKVCVYAIGAAMGDGVYEGDFVRGRALTAAEAATAWSAAASTPGPAPACDATAPTEFGILQAADGGSAFYWVELDGCQRVYSDRDTAHPASPELLALFG